MDVTGYESNEYDTSMSTKWLVSESGKTRAFIFHPPSPEQLYFNINHKLSLITYLLHCTAYQIQSSLSFFEQKRCHIEGNPFRPSKVFTLLVSRNHDYWIRLPMNSRQGLMLSGMAQGAFKILAIMHTSTPLIV